MNNLIAEYRARGAMATIVPFTATINTGSFTKASAADFTFRDRTYNLGRLAENITVDLKGAPLDLALALGSASVPFGGSAVAAAPPRPAPAAGSAY
ncbi:MAG: hypothetical protein JNN08_11520 [Bryobacterales bacterium]|nr:hypothetical protein [Bryobacterales bacterium]